jgi:hypothetical protein
MLILIIIVAAVAHLGARGPWISVPGPFGTRIGHRL